MDNLNQFRTAVLASPCEAASPCISEHMWRFESIEWRLFSLQRSATSGKEADEEETRSELGHRSSVIGHPGAGKPRKIGMQSRVVHCANLTGLSVGQIQTNVTSEPTVDKHRDKITYAQVQLLTNHSVFCILYFVLHSAQ